MTVSRIQNRAESAGTPGSALRVLLLVDHLRENGGLRVTIDLMERLRAIGIQADLFVLQRVGGEPTLPLDPQLPVRYATDARRQLRAALPAGLVRLVALAGGYDVIVSASEIGYSLLLGRLAARLRRRPYLVLVQAPLVGAIAAWTPRGLQALTRHVHGSVDASICVSHGLVPDILATGLPPERVHVVDVGVDVDRVRELGRQVADPPRPVARYLVGVGRLTEQKGFDLLIRAHAKVVDRGHHHRLIIVGEGADRAALTELARRLGVSDTVGFTGFVPNPHWLIAGADLFVLSSRREGSGGLVLVEALSHGVPVVAADCVSGPRDILADGRFGALVPADDVEALADAIAAHLADPAPLRERAEHGPARAREYDPARTAQRFAEIAGQLAARSEDG
ncbi:MAG TPA: glycosyltransferase [Nakamurella sp.]